MGLKELDCAQQHLDGTVVVYVLVQAQVFGISQARTFCLSVGSRAATAQIDAPVMSVNERLFSAGSTVLVVS
jgi:hypothetical protein